MNFVFALLLLAGPEYPKQTGLVNDFAGVLSAPVKTKLEESLAGLQKAKSFVVVVVTVSSLEGQPIEQYTVGLANKWAIGEKGKNNGIVFLIAPSEKAVRIENGYGAEGTLTDIESKFIMEEKVIPLFKEGKMAEGIAAGTDALVAKLGGGVPIDARGPPPAEKPGAGMVALIIIVVIVVIILMCFEGGREFLWVILNIALAAGGGGGGGGSKKGSSGGSSSGGGGKFGGGGASSKW